MGAGRVIMIGRGRKLEIARKMGADICIDFEKEDPVARVLELTGGVGADEVMECSGANDSPAKACQLVKKTGAVALIANYRDDLEQVPLPLNKIVFNEIKIYGSKANPGVSRAVLKFLSDGSINGKGLITHTFPLDQYEDLRIHHAASDTDFDEIGSRRMVRINQRPQLRRIGGGFSKRAGCV